MKMQSEITVEVLCSKEALFEIFRKEHYFFKEPFEITDYYYSHMTPDKCSSFQQLLSNSFLIRDIKMDRKFFDPNTGASMLLYKKKIFDDNGFPISEQKIASNIRDVEKANQVFLMSGLTNWCVKKINGYPFRKGNIHILVQDVKGLGLFLELEQFEGQTGTPDEILNELVEIINNLGIPTGNEYHISIAYRLFMQQKKTAPASFNIRKLILTDKKDGKDGLFLSFEED